MRRNRVTEPIERVGTGFRKRTALFETRFRDCETPMILLYTDTAHCRGMRRGRYHELLRYALEQRTLRWAIYEEYRRDERFHNATDSAFLVDHDDAYWHNRGVPGPVGQYPNSLLRAWRRHRHSF